MWMMISKVARWGQEPMHVLYTSVSLKDTPVDIMVPKTGI